MSRSTISISPLTRAVISAARYPSQRINQIVERYVSMVEIAERPTTEQVRCARLLLAAAAREQRCTPMQAASVPLLRLVERHGSSLSACERSTIIRAMSVSAACTYKLLDAAMEEL